MNAQLFSLCRLPKSNQGCSARVEILGMPRRFPADGRASQGSCCTLSEAGRQGARGICKHGRLRCAPHDDAGCVYVGSSCRARTGAFLKAHFPTWTCRGAGESAVTCQTARPTTRTTLDRGPKPCEVPSTAAASLVSAPAQASDRRLLVPWGQRGGFQRSFGARNSRPVTLVSCA